MSFAWPRIAATTREVGPIDDVLAHADPADPLVWCGAGGTMVGVGRLDAAALGVDAALADGARPAEVWREIAGRASVEDEVGRAGTGLVAFGTLPFDEASAAPARLIVPRVILASRGGRSWVTSIRLAGEQTPPEPVRTGYGPHWSGSVGPGLLSAQGYENAVREALDLIDAGGIEKVVLARDLRGSVPPGSDLRRLVRALIAGYPQCWGFAVDGLIGASPETLVTVSGRTVTSRLLAGTAARGPDGGADERARAALAASAKNRAEHAFAVRSVVDALAPHLTGLATTEPFTLDLPNLWHLATDVTGTLANGASALDLALALHPTAAVAGTPREAALAAIRRLEPFDRGRYAGPVGWIDGDGEGEWAIALRSAQFGVPAASDDPIPVTAYAGAGIVAGSDPEAEVLETRVKFRPIVDALA